jgi:hypothetical protein
MRRWVCIITLLAGFSADGYVWSARRRLPVPIERRLDATLGTASYGVAPRTSLQTTSAWWRS